MSRPRLIATLACTLIAWVMTLRAAPAGPEIEIDFLYGDHELFPSMLVSSTSYCLYAPRGGEDQLGDKLGVISARIRNPAANTRVKVTIAETAYFAESSAEETMAEAGRTYWVAPTVRYLHEKLATLKQPLPNLVLKIAVEVGGPASVTREFYRQIVVHSVNDCMWAYQPRGDTAWNFDVRAFTAAFINENSPVIDQVITKYALEKKLVTEFRGYYGDRRPTPTTRKVNETEIRAVYETLRALGFKYASLAQASVYVAPVSPAPEGGPGLAATGAVKLEQARIRVQYIRLPGDALASRQANGIEAAALLASVYRKLSLHTVMMMVHNRERDLPEWLLGVYLTRPKNPDEFLVIDPQLLGSDDFEAAVKAGDKKFQAAKRFLLPDPADRFKESYKLSGYLWIDIDEARANGVLPIAEFSP